MSDGQMRITADDGALALTLDMDSAMNYALVHNGISPLTALLIENRSDEPLPAMNLEIELSGPVEGRIAETFRGRLPDLDERDELHVDMRSEKWHFDPATFAQLDEAVTATVTATVLGADRSLRADGTIRLLARDEWWALTIEESLAAFVTPRAGAVQQLVSEASDLLGAQTGSSAVQGYQLGSGRAMEIAQAIYDAMSARKIRYINPPASFEGTGQKIRPPHEVLDGRFGTCLDLATTYAAALEHAGLNPVIVLCDGHAFAGHLADELQLPELVLRDRSMILNYVDSGLFVPVETVELCDKEPSSSFEKAVEATRVRWTEQIDGVRCLIDIAQAHRIVRPLPAVTFEDGVRVVEVDGGRPARPRPLPAANGASSAAPATRGGERTHQEFPPRVEQWRNSLLDLSFRNPLLNNRTGRTSVDLHVPHGSLGLLEDLLYEGQSLDVVPHDQLAEIHRARGARTAQDVEPESLRAMLEQGRLHAAVTEASYLTRMRGIQRRAKTVLEETGANNLFVTLGMLEWEDNKRQARAPLFLLPVTIAARRGRPYTLRIDDGGFAQPNQCLIEKLRVGHGLTIPLLSEPDADDSGIDLDGSFQAIRLAMLEAQLPFAVEESAHLSLLQFSTLQLWQDLSENWQTFMRNPVIRHLVETPTDSFSDPSAEAEVDADAEASTHCPIAVDGSQLQAVTWAEAGRSFVLEGPPGTGKSQTITNLIANALAADKTVLFVAEKQAALDVVKRRLDKVGLGDLCLDLHGKEQTAAAVRSQLSAALHLHCTTNPESWAATRADHQSAVSSLGRYPAALHEPGGAGLSAWTARQALLTAGEGDEIDIPAAIVAAPLDTAMLYENARELTQALYDLGTKPADHPWRLAQLSAADLGEHRADVRDAVTALVGVVSDAETTPHAAVLASMPGRNALEQVARWTQAVTTSGWTVDVDAVALAAEPQWRAQLDNVHAQMATLRDDATAAMATFTPEVVTSVDLDDLLLRAKVADGKLFKGKSRKAVIADLATVMLPDATIEPATITPWIESLIGLRSRARELAARVREVPGIEIPDGWNPLETEAAAPIESQAAALLATVDLVREAPALPAVLRDKPSVWSAREAADVVQRLAGAWRELVAQLRCDEESVTAWCAGRPTLFDAIRDRCTTWSSDATAGDLVPLGRWTEVHDLLARLEGAGISALAEGVCTGGLHPDDIEPVLRRSIARAALAERLSATALSGFDGVVRDRAIERFSMKADEMRRDMIAELPARIVGSRPFSPDRLVGKAGELSRELKRKRGGLKIRELFASYGQIIGELTPCLMMSPHSVARFLPADALDIDLVVFDEASQIRVAESISAMGRGKATVVVGDSQQMPPSNIAAITTAADDDGVQAALGIPADMESVLSEAVESNLPRLWLSWHYRSQHESLITFSNHKYYDGRLASFPRPPGDHAGLGVSWRRVDGTFERSAGRVNRVEAAEIVAEIRARLAADANASIGVVTFNTQQRDLVLDLLEESADPRVADALTNEGEPLFVKNLENVQGDERDVILFSLAFSVNQDTGKLPLNFGPLVQAGGERRLNVAVTRARAQVVLFSSFDPSHVDLSRSSSTGLAHLRHYMEMAQRQAASLGALRPPTARDRHHEDVVAALTAAGLRVREHVGLSDFTVDIAVASSDDGPWVAVFLDGPDYARRATVGDRETLPHGVLVGFMGWSRVERIWLPDWIRDRQAVIDEIVRVASAAPEPEASVPLPESLPPAPSPEEILAPTREEERVPLYAGAPGAPAAPVSDAGPVFTPAHCEHVGDRQMLEELATDPRCREAVLEQIDDVLLHEAPIVGTRLARIVGRRFGLQRVAAKRAAAILELIPHGQIENTPFGKVVWAAGQDRKSFDGFRTGGSETRAIDEIAPQEIVNAMHDLAKAGGGISREELVRETANAFSYSRVAAGTRDHLEALLDHGRARGRLREDEGTIFAAM